jgi:hypothetical protein
MARANKRKTWCEYGNCGNRATHWIWTRQRRYPSGEMVECNTSACEEHWTCRGFASHRDPRSFLREDWDRDLAVRL